MQIWGKLQKRPIIRLTHADGKVVVEPEDEDRFVMTSRRAVRACQDSHRREEALRTFKQGFLVPLFDWCIDHAGRVQACYLPVPTAGHVKVFVVGTSPKYDFNLGREVSALELQLADAHLAARRFAVPRAYRVQLEERSTLFAHKPLGRPGRASGTEGVLANF